MLYIGTIAASVILLGLVIRKIRRTPELIAGLEPPDLTPSISDTLLLALALAVSVAIPATSYFPMLLLFLDDPLQRFWHRLRADG